MNEWTSCWCSGTPVGASALLLVLRHSCWCSDTPVGATALPLRGYQRFDWCSGTPSGATELLLREQAHFDWCSGTPVGATRHFCCVSRHVLIGAPALLLVLRHSCFVLYLWVLIILRPTQFL